MSTQLSDLIAGWLVRQGIEQVFAVTGGGAMFLNQALGSHPGLRCTFMHHEQACAMAAEGYARIKGKPAVVMLTTGPGALNAINGVFGAYTDSIPMLVLSGQVKRATCLDFHQLPDLRQLGDQEGPTIAVAGPVCKFARLLRTPEDMQQLLPQAYVQAVSGRPGPVWLDIPLDIQSAQVDFDIPDPVFPAPTQNPDLPAICAQIAARLRTANRPLVLGGTGVRLANAVPDLLQLCETHGLPMATAWTHDLIASEHPLFAGRPGTIGTRPGNFALQAADWVLVIGSRLNIRQSSYNWDAFAKNAFVVQVDIDAAELNKPGVPVDLSLQCDAKPFVAALGQALQKLDLPNFSPWQAWVRELGQRFDVRHEHPQAPHAALNPYAVVERIFKQLRPDDVVVCGNASACIIPFQIGRLGPNNRMFSNSGAASMGYDLPAALGAAVAQRPGRVLCFAGDGSLQMNIQELQTLKTAGLPIIILVLNNAGYLSISQTHENFFGRVIGANPASGVEFPDFCQVARAYGIEAATIASVADLDRLDEWLQAKGPLLLNLIVDPKQNFEPRCKSRLDSKGQFITPELDDMYPFLDPATVAAVRSAATQIRSAAA